MLRLGGQPLWTTWQGLARATRFGGADNSSFQIRTTVIL